MVAVLCGLLATIAGLLTEYQFAPFVADGSRRYFLLHVSGLQPLTLVSIGTGRTDRFLGAVSTPHFRGSTEDHTSGVIARGISFVGYINRAALSRPQAKAGASTTLPGG